MNIEWLEKVKDAMIHLRMCSIAFGKDINDDTHSEMIDAQIELFALAQKAVTPK